MEGYNVFNWAIMSLISDILEYNKSFVNNKEYEKFITSKYPDKKLVILTCMDTRLVELLPKAMNLQNGDAKIIKNAGATISYPFGSVMRSILVALYELNAKEVCVVGHYDCGMNNFNYESIIRKAKESHISEERINTLINAGINLKQ